MAPLAENCWRFKWHCDLKIVFYSFFFFPHEDPRDEPQRRRFHSMAVIDPGSSVSLNLEDLSPMVIKICPAEELLSKVLLILKQCKSQRGVCLTDLNI